MHCKFGATPRRGRRQSHLELYRIAQSCTGRYTSRYTATPGSTELQFPLCMMQQHLVAGSGQELRSVACVPWCNPLHRREEAGRHATGHYS